MIKLLRKFRKDETGAVTVDWVVLTAAVVGLAVAAYSAIETQTANLVGATADTLSTQDADPTAIPTTTP